MRRNLILHTSLQIRALHRNHDLVSCHCPEMREVGQDPGLDAKARPFRKNLRLDGLEEMDTRSWDRIGNAERAMLVLAHQVVEVKQQQSGKGYKNQPICEISDFQSTPSLPYRAHAATAPAHVAISLTAFDAGTTQWRWKTCTAPGTFHNANILLPEPPPVRANCANQSKFRPLETSGQ